MILVHVAQEKNTNSVAVKMLKNNKLKKEFR